MQIDLLHKAMANCPHMTKDWLTLCSIEGQVTLTQSFTGEQLTKVSTIYMRYNK